MVEAFYRLFSTDLRLPGSMSRKLLGHLAANDAICSYTQESLTTILETDLELEAIESDASIALIWIHQVLPVFPAAVKVLNNVSGGQVKLSTGGQMHVTDVLSSLMRQGVKMKLGPKTSTACTVRTTTSIFLRGDGTTRKVGSHRENSGHQ
jgi:hypothetical protein